MTEEKKSTNPFGDISAELYQSDEEVVIRTMKDDIASLEKSSPSIQNQKPISTSQQIKPVSKPMSAPLASKTSVTAKTTPEELRKSSPFAEDILIEKPAPKRIASEIPKADVPTSQITSSLPKESILKPIEKPPVKPTPSGSYSNPSMVYKLSFVAIILIIIFILGGGYYYYSKLSNDTYVPSQQTTDLQPAPEENTNNQQPDMTPAVEKYSSTKPNYLPMDLSVLSAADVKAQLENVASELKTSQRNGLFEFIIVDANNNPISFPNFSKASNLIFTTETINKLSNAFSLFIYNDGEFTRMGFKTGFYNANSEQVKQSISAQEKTLLSDTAFLILDSNTSTDKTFASSQYGDFAIRYLNIDSEKKLSIDYTVTNDSLIIATSKDTLRAILDNQKKEDSLSSQSQVTNQTQSSVAPENQPTQNTTEPATTELPEANPTPVIQQ